MGEEPCTGTGAPMRAVASSGVVLRSRAWKEKEGAPVLNKNNNNGSELTHPELALARHN